MGGWEGVSLVFWRGCCSQTRRRGGLGRAIPGFQRGEEKGAGFATTQHPRSDHCGGIPTCCAVQKAGTRHSTSTPRRLQSQLQTSLHCPSPSTNLRPQPSCHRRDHHRRQNYRTSNHWLVFTPRHSSLSQCQNGNRIQVL